MEEPAVLFIEKINFKLPEGNAFLPHQDAPAFTSFNQHYHIILMLSMDAAKPANGCLEMVAGRLKKVCYRLHLIIQWIQNLLKYLIGNI
jgi:ectoine hydroxylase-related dioxygenase (phytanoyl-CoA dioxygenase family)